MLLVLLAVLSVATACGRKPRVIPEKKLVRMLRNGIQIRDIAAEFGLAEITIKKALAKLYQKYNVKNRSRLCAYFDKQENDF